jgi:branched-chain amino acid aminotransferase
MKKENQQLWLDDKFLPWADANIHVMTYTFHYGVGVYEGVRSYKAKQGTAVFRLACHTQRLLHSAKILNISAAYNATTLLKAQCELLKKNQLDAAYIRPMIFYDGQGYVGMDLSQLQVRTMIAAFAWQNPKSAQQCEQGIRVCTAALQRHSAKSNFNRAKANANYLNAIMALHEGKRAGFDEVLMLDQQGMVAEASAANIFMVQGNELITPPATTALPGITRDTVMTLAPQLGLTVVERMFTREEVYIADEVFLTGTATEVLPVCEVDGRKISQQKYTDQLRRLYQQVVTGELREYQEWLTYIA